MARRGFWAELEHQSQLAAKRQHQALRARERERVAAQRRAEQARRQAERAREQQRRAAAAQQKQAEREAKRLYEEARLAEAASMNADLSALAEELELLLEATLDVDDHVDLATLRRRAEHPVFDPQGLEIATPRPDVRWPPPEPVFVEPLAPTGLTALGGAKRHLAALEAANLAFADRYRRWAREADEVIAERRRQVDSWERDEARRRQRLDQARRRFDEECAIREARAMDANRALDALIVDLERGTASAVQEYLEIALGRSVYPEVLGVEHELVYDAVHRELAVTVLVCAPEELPQQRSYKWVKARDEIDATLLPKRDLKVRYADIVDQIALRTLHEVFEADRAGHVETIALELAVEANDPATGRRARTCLLAVAAARDHFVAFDLHNVVPSATLEYLAASRSKDPHSLVGLDATAGVRRL